MNWEKSIYSNAKDTALLREKLTELEGQMQKINTRKQVLVARMKAADATSKAIELLHKTSNMSAVAVLEQMERRVAELEAQAQALKELGGSGKDSGASE